MLGLEVGRSVDQSLWMDLIVGRNWRQRMIKAWY